MQMFAHPSFLIIRGISLKQSLFDFFNSENKSINSINIMIILIINTLILNFVTLQIKMSVYK